MTLVGHVSLALLLYKFIPAPFNWILIVLSHFLFDIYPDYYPTNESLSTKKGILKNGLFVLSTITLFCLFGYLMIFRCWFITINNFIWVSVLAMFPDITEGIYASVVFIAKHFKKKLPDKFWFNHDGFFPFHYNNWQYATKTFRCLSTTKTFFIDALFASISLLVYVLTFTKFWL